MILVTYDASAPIITITTPTSDPVYAAIEASITLAGTALDDVQLSNVAWFNSRGGSGFATGTSNWSVASIPLQIGDNVITVLAHDTAGNTGQDQLTVNFQPIQLPISSTPRSIHRMRHR